MAPGKALIVGVGDGLSASLARRLAGEGYDLALASRRPERLADLAAETGASMHRCDASVPAEVEALFAGLGQLSVVVYNASFRVRGPLQDLDPADVRKTLDVTAFGAFLVAQQAARAMLPAGEARSCSRAPRRA